MRDLTARTLQETRNPRPRPRAGAWERREGGVMGKRSRKKKDRRKNKANHGKRPNGS